MNIDFDYFFDELKKAVKSLDYSMDSDYSQIKDVINNKQPLPQGCPSKESAIEIILRGTKGKIDEVNGMYKIVTEKLFNVK